MQRYNIICICERSEYVAMNDCLKITSSKKLLHHHKVDKLQGLHQLMTIFKCFILFQISDSENEAKVESPFFIFL